MLNFTVKTYVSVSQSWVEAQVLERYWQWNKLLFTTMDCHSFIFGAFLINSHFMENCPFLKLCHLADESSCAADVHIKIKPQLLKHRYLVCNTMAQSQLNQGQMTSMQSKPLEWARAFPVIKTPVLFFITIFSCKKLF